MTTLRLDALTAAVALDGLAPRENGLEQLAQAIDEEWRRFSPPQPIPAGLDIETRHLVSTMGNRQDSVPTSLTYGHTQFIQPGHVRAERREMKDRFLRGAPSLTAEVRPTDEGYLLETAILTMGPHLTAMLDWARGHATFYVMKGQLPGTVMMAAAGRRLGDIVSTGHGGDLVIQDMYTAEMTEMRDVLGRMRERGIAIRTELPGWTSVGFTPIYEHTP